MNHAADILTQTAAEDAQDKREFDRLLRRHGPDTVLTWYYEWLFRVTPDPQPDATDPRRI